MKRFLLAVPTLCFSLGFSAWVSAQTDMAPSDTAPAAEVTNDMADDASMQPAAESPEDRIQRECREWAVQDGVPAEELSTYISDCVEDRQAQE